MIDSRQAAGTGGKVQSFRRILAVCDLDQAETPALALAADLARAGDARLTVLAIRQPSSDLDQLAQFAAVPRDEVQRRLLADDRERLLRRVAGIAGDLPVETVIRAGKPFLEIIRQVVDHDHDLVIKTAEVLHGLHRFLFASTDQHLLRKCPCPVWLRLPDSRRPARTVLAAVDVDEVAAGEPQTQAALNRVIIETAARIALFEGAVLRVLHAWEAPGEGLVRQWSDAGSKDDVVRRYLGDVELQHWRALDRLVASAASWLGETTLARIALTPHLVRGVATTVIPEQTRALDADILVMGTIARTGVPGFIIGNTAEDVLNSVDCSVVTVKPPGYVSPVQA